MSFVLEALVGILILFGSVFAFIGAIGLIRLPDFFTRLHAPTKATTLGIGSILIASVIYMSVQERTLSLHELLITLFLFISAPITANVLAKTALHHQLTAYKGTRGLDAKERHRDALPMTEKEAMAQLLSVSPNPSKGQEGN